MSAGFSLLVQSTLSVSHHHLSMRQTAAAWTSDSQRRLTTSMIIVKAPYIMFLGMVLSVAQARNNDIGRRVYDPGKGIGRRGNNEMSVSAASSTGISQSGPTGSLTRSAAVASGTAVSSKSCLGNGTQAMVQCLFDSTKKECTGFGGGCAVLGRYLPVAPDDESACIPDVTLAAEVCANCNGTQEGYDLYNRYLTACTSPGLGGSDTQQSGTLSAAGVIPTSLPGVPGQAETKTTGVGIQATSGVLSVTDGVASRQTSLSGPAVQHSTTGGVKSASDVGGQIPSDTKSSGPVASGTSDIPREGALPPSGIAAAEEGLITAIPSPVIDDGVVMGENTPVSSTMSGVDADLTGYPGIDNEESRRPSSVLSLATVTGNPAASTGKAELERALGAVELFFEHDIDESCKQEEDGCTDWQVLIEDGTSKAICQSSAFQHAMDCSACVGAAGKSNQTTYQAQMEAYGWYKNNCTLVGGVSKTASGGGMVAVESVDGPRADATRTGKTAGMGAPAKAEAAADGKPHVVYVNGAAITRSILSMPGWVCTVIAAVLLSV